MCVCVYSKYIYLQKKVKQMIFDIRFHDYSTSLTDSDGTTQWAPLEESLSLLVFYVTCNNISVIHVTAQMRKKWAPDNWNQ